jgi:hypothetical protein
MNMETTGARRPDIGETIGFAYRNAWPTLVSRRTVYTVLAAICALAGIGLPFVHGMGVSPNGLNFDFSTRLQLAVQTPNLLGGLAALFVVVPTVARVANPAFRMTAGKFFGMIGVAIVVAIATELGFVLLIVPGVYLAVKLSQAVWAFLVIDGKNPWAESWAITKGSFWHTLLFLIAAGFAGALPLVGFFVAAPLAAAVPVLGFALLPAAFVCFVFSYHVLLLAQIFWMTGLRSAAPPAGMDFAPVPTSI